MAVNADGQPLLHTFQKHIEDMRNLVQCQICIKPLYEPFILGCGHSYCYSCLTSWFTGGNAGQRRRQSMKCPDCRAAVVLEPSPNYVLRDVVHMFISRTELLSEDETTNEHEMAKAEEAVLMTADRNGVGLFKGAFRDRQAVQYGAAGRPGPMHDPHDGVDRCPECHWELEHGRCGQCDWSISDEDEFSDDDEFSDSEIDMDEIERFAAGDEVRRRFDGHFDPMESPTGSFLAALDEDRNPFGLHRHEEDGSVITISSDVDDIDPVDHEIAGLDAETQSEAESLPEAMGGRPRLYDNHTQAARREFSRLYGSGHESDVQSTNYDDSEMGDTNLQMTSEMGDSEEDEEEEDSSQMDGFIEHDTPTHIPHRVHVPHHFNRATGIYISSDDEVSDDERNTNRELSQAPTTTTNASATTADSSSEDESRRTPVPRSRPSRQTRVILDDSDEDQDEDQENSDENDNNGDESDATATPAQPAPTRRSHLQIQRARRGRNTMRGVLPPRRPNVPYSRGEFGNGSVRHQPYLIRATSSRRGMTQAHVAG